VCVVGEEEGVAEVAQQGRHVGGLCVVGGGAGVCSVQSFFFESVEVFSCREAAEGKGGPGRGSVGR